MRKAKARSVKAEKKRRRKTNQEIVLVTYFFTLLFVGIIGYLGYFIYFKSSDYANSEYNSKRQTLSQTQYIRGDILSADGKTLATTKTADSTETRYYPFGSVFAHVVGYSTRGITGLESVANSYLLSSHSNLILQAADSLQDKKILGDTVVTTLDSKLQQVAYDAMGDYKGAVVVMNPKTGAVLAMVSKPDYDPNQIADIWDQLTSDTSNSNLVNRATQGLYPPGSTFKIITSLEYIRENPSTYSKFTYDCDSVYTVGDYSIKCSHSTSHGEQDFTQAFANSCNGAFAKIGQTLNFAKVYNLCSEFGYNQTLPISLLSKASSFTVKDSSSLWDVLQSSIGQGTTTVTPLQNLLVAATVANNGVMMKPYLIDHVEDTDGNTVETFSPETNATIMTSSEAAILKKMMRAVVTEGTGTKAQGEGYTVAGKTGSAEWATGKDPHAWFVGFANVEDPEIAVCVIVEQGNSGGSTAAPIAKKIFDAYFAEKK